MALIFTVLFGLVVQVEGLAPFRPPANTPVERELRLYPQDDAPLVRQLEPTDLFTFLRSDGAWYEVDVQTKTGLFFRGWVKGQIASERLDPVVEKKLAPKPATKVNPLKSDDFIWLWDPRLEDRLRLRLDGGYANLSYKLTGLQNGTRNTIYTYGFSGISLGGALQLDVLRVFLAEKELTTFFDFRYRYGLYRLSFASNFEVAELRGKGYEFNTHTFHIEGMSRYRVAEGNWGYMEPFVGVGFIYHESAPDLTRLSGGQLLFTTTTMSGLTSPVGIKMKLPFSISVQLKGSPIWFAEVSEDNLQSPSISADGFPFYASAEFGMMISETFGFELLGEYLNFSGKSSGPGSRLSHNYDDGQISTTNLSINAGIKARF